MRGDSLTSFVSKNGPTGGADGAGGGIVSTTSGTGSATTGAGTSGTAASSRIELCAPAGVATAGTPPARGGLGRLGVEAFGDAVVVDVESWVDVVVGAGRCLGNARPAASATSFTASFATSATGGCAGASTCGCMLSQ